MMLDPEQSGLFPELPHAGLIKAATRQVRAKFGRLGRERLLLAARSAAVRAACEERKFQEQPAWREGAAGEAACLPDGRVHSG